MFRKAAPAKTGTVKKSGPAPKTTKTIKAAPKKAAPARTVKKAAPKSQGAAPVPDSPFKDFGQKLPGGGTPGATVLGNAPPTGAPTASAPTYAKPNPVKVKESLDKWYGPGRRLYLPGGLLTTDDIPSYLDGSLAGDYGFDPLGLGQDKEQVAKYREYELIHARWAMLAVAGIFFADSATGVFWQTVGKDVLDGQTIPWNAAPFASVENPLPLPAILAIQVGLMGAVENYRVNGAGPSGFAPGIGEFDESQFNGLDPINPGGPLDFLGLAKDEDELALLKVKEIKNGRLAMVTMLAFTFQGIVTGEGPYQNWAKHVVDPFAYNFVTITASERAATF